MSSYAADLMSWDYKPIAPSPEAEQIDAEIVEEMRCRHCGGQLRYEPYTAQGSYIALAVCVDCGREVEF